MDFAVWQCFLINFFLNGNIKPSLTLLKEVNGDLNYLFATMIATGSIQILIGILRLAKFVRMVSKPVTYGFVDGLAIVVAMAQLGGFRVVCFGCNFGA